MIQAANARQRLEQLADEKGVSLKALSEMIGRNSAYLQQFIKRGTPKKLEEDDRKMLAQFFGVSEGELSAASFVGVKDKSYTSAKPMRESIYVNVPRLDVGASAGPGALPTGEDAFDAFRFSHRWLAEQGLEGAQLSAITVEGDSMEPLLNNGDEILVDRSPQPFRDGVHVVRLDDALLVKRVANTGGGRLALLSQNMAYPPIDVAAQDVEIIGRVVWKGGRI